jgi:AbrB family looped-hinge helix DNA binding protein
MAEATLSSKNQIVVPREIREALGIRSGDRILIVVRNATMILLPKPDNYAAAIRGIGRATYPRGYVRKERESWK